MKNYYYIIITDKGERIPIKTKMAIKSIKIAEYYVDTTVSCIILSDYVHYLSEKNKNPLDKYLDLIYNR